MKRCEVMKALAAQEEIYVLEFSSDGDYPFGLSKT